MLFSIQQEFASPELFKARETKKLGGISNH